MSSTPGDRCRSLTGVGEASGRVSRGGATGTHADSPARPCLVDCLTPYCLWNQGVTLYRTPPPVRPSQRTPNELSPAFNPDSAMSLIIKRMVTSPHYSVLRTKSGRRVFDTLCYEWIMPGLSKR